MTQKYILKSAAKAGGIEVATFQLLDSAGEPIPGADLKLSQPKGGGLYAAFDDGDVVEMSLTKIVPPVETPAN